MAADMDPLPGADAVATPTLVVLMDSNPNRRGVMRSVFEHSDVDATVMGEADGRPEAIALVQDIGAGLIVLDFAMQAADGLETVAALRARFPDLAIVVCSFNSQPATREKALAAGADAYLLKPVSAREVLAAAAGSPRRTGPLQPATVGP